MSNLRVALLPNSSVLKIYSQRQYIQTDPDYQRMSEVWPLEKRQLLIDSIINDFDLPKLYFHDFGNLKKLPDGRKVQYAIIDGRQRLETIWAFIDGNFSLSRDFMFYKDPSVKAQGATYGDLAAGYPELRIAFDSFTLPIMSVQTEDLEMIEEMFSRLNEAVPLNSAEQRNAFGGPMAKTIRTIADRKFFRNCVPFSNKRYQHREVSTKFLWLAYTSTNADPMRRIVDTKKIYLDKFVQDFKDKKAEIQAEELKENVEGVLSDMEKIFISSDSLLKTQAMCVIYFLCFFYGGKVGKKDNITRERLRAFEDKRTRNRETAEKDIAEADYLLLEFDRMSLQGSNDAASIRSRLGILAQHLDLFDEKSLPWML